ncbi:MAG: prepilin-type N-terminal cleavage/methylation domain-containing protein [Glaciecola sp.]|jgi:MSHA pilin protein MshA|nr:prepilin-type N-terminal cleavage/methylation domain-containing protein [Glaciecola sp.]MDG2099528.1 prepilin-type N-terminal cleavage/methylation domain-containing protein [Glaciecola sp.]
MRIKRGFTVIELIIVIVILGIMSVMAMPKMINFSQEARVASVSTMQSALEAASKLTYYKCQVSQNCSTSAWGPIQTIDGKAYCLLNGWFDAGRGGPLGSNPIGTCGIDRYIKYNGFSVMVGTGSASGHEHWFTLDNAPDPENCRAVYRQPDNLGDLPDYSSVTTGC